MEPVTVIDIDETDLFDLHVGLEPERVAAFVDVYVPWPDPDSGYTPVVFHGADIGGPSWEQWGESTWDVEDNPTAPGPEKGEHVIVRCTSIVSALMSLAAIREEGFNLIPMEFENQRKIVACITSSQDWGEVFLSVKAGPRFPDLHMPTDVG